MKLKKEKKDKFSYKQYTINIKNEEYLLDAFENLEIIQLGSFSTIDDVKKFIRSRDKKARQEQTCVHCGIEKSYHKANTFECPQSKKRFTSFYNDQFFLSISDSKK